jgi:hypothetical protein
MEFVWNLYGTPMEHHQSHTGATPEHRVVCALETALQAGVAANLRVPDAAIATALGV